MTNSCIHDVGLKLLIYLHVSLLTQLYATLIFLFLLYVAGQIDEVKQLLNDPDVRVDCLDDVSQPL